VLIWQGAAQLLVADPLRSVIGYGPSPCGLSITPTILPNSLIMRLVTPRPTARTMRPSTRSFRQDSLVSIVHMFLYVVFSTMHSAGWGSFVDRV